ncbi:MAG: hypothetical protein EA000_00080 [Oscillatoriales cyanobacterium]|nr:MAG: hypothetical protein EA000_00080 [Oscillatoriales cyanobacterium]
MITVPDWLIYSLICSLLYGFWGFFGNLATKYVDYQTAFFYEAMGAILMTLFIPEIGYYITTNYWCFVRDRRSNPKSFVNFLLPDLHKVRVGVG